MSDSNGKPKRPVVCLGMPGYQGLTSGAARGFFRASACRKFDLHLSEQGSSLLAHNMNILWCWALDQGRKGKCDYFAMQHSDVEPQEFWLDVLFEELRDRDLDVLGVVAPIKDMRGVTSIAMADPEGTNWRIKARLTMAEVFRLPATFTSEDLGYPLLLNTGLWICRFGEGWAKKVHFEINDRIVWNTKLEQYVPEVEPEDWFFSRLCHEQGLKIGCTRKVRLNHRGTMAFGNTKPWGEHQFDREYLSESPLIGEASDWFPADVPGWLTEAEGRKLAELARGKVVLEIGSYCGRSTICLARTARSVGAVDTFDGRGTPGQIPDTLPMFLEAVNHHGVADRINVLHGTSADILPTLPAIFDLIFIDGSHDRESVERDVELSLPRLREGGVLAFHDYCSPIDPGVTAAVDELLGTGGELISLTDTLAVIRPILTAVEV